MNVNKHPSKFVYGRYFSLQLYNGMKKGVPISPYLFNIFMDGLNERLGNAGSEGCIKCIDNSIIYNFSWAAAMVFVSPCGNSFMSC